MTIWKVTSPTAIKLIDFIKSQLDSQCSSRQIKRWIESNHCYVNQRIERFASSMVTEGDLIEFHSMDTLLGSSTQFHPARANILYESSDLLIFNKSAGISCTDSTFVDSFNELNLKLSLIHRLDKDTSGALLLSKSYEMLKAMIHAFKERKIVKTYLALVEGNVEKENGVIESYLGKIASYQGQSLWGHVGKKRGLYSQTKWKIKQRGIQTTLLECSPITGRTHQIRVHLASMGHPILGDYQYGKNFKSSFRPLRCLLHALSLSFKDPLHQHSIYAEAPLPSDFLSALQILNKGKGDDSEISYY